jgi:hypothetical protein
MILMDNKLQVLAGLRADVVKMVGAIRDSSSGFMRFNDPSPNWLTLQRLNTCLNTYEKALIELGFVRVVLHAPCGAPGHEERAQDIYGHRGYWRYILADGTTDADHVVDGRIVLNGTLMDTNFDDAVQQQTTSTSSCPCRPGKLSAEHSVSPYFLWPSRPDSLFQEMADLTLMLKDAILRSKDRRRRSGIREVLLQTLITIDQMIVEETAEEVLIRRGFSK